MDGENPFVSEYRDYNTDCRVKFEIVIPTLSNLSDEELDKKLGLSCKLAISNMTLFNAQGSIVKFDSPEDILREWYALRLEYYEKRKAQSIHFSCPHSARRTYSRSSRKTYHNLKTESDSFWP